MNGFGPLAALPLATVSRVTIYTLVCDVGTFVLSGKPLTAFRTSMVASKGTYSLNGVAAAFRTSMAAATGTYTMTGRSLTAFRVSMPAAVGSYILTGMDAALGAVVHVGGDVAAFLKRRRRPRRR